MYLGVTISSNHSRAIGWVWHWPRQSNCLASIHRPRYT